jgi:hypothetical protein
MHRLVRRAHSWIVTLPNIQQPQQHQLVHIVCLLFPIPTRAHPIQPYVPDFWHSKPHLPVLDHPIPKLVVVAGSDTHHAGGPSHNLHDIHTEPSVHVQPTIASPSSGLVHDVMDDIGVAIPPSFRTTVTDILAQPSEKFKGQSRELDKDETRGVWLLLGLLASSWVASGVLAK